MAEEFFQQITPAQALQLASLGPQESPITSASGASDFQQTFEVSEIVALLKELGDQEWVRVYFAYGADPSSSDYKWLNGVILGSRELNPTETDPAVNPDHVEFLTTMSEDPTQVYPHQISAADAAEIKSLGFQWGKQAFHVSGIFALLATIEEEPAVDGKKWMYVYYAYEESKQLKSVVLGSRPLSPMENSTAMDPKKVEFLDHTNEYPLP